MEKYFGDWEDLNGLKRDFREEGSAEFPSDAEILFACYTYEDYSGDALVVYQRDGKLFEVNGSHCSCYGLEDQWSPEETSDGALEMRRIASRFPSEAVEAFRARWPERT